MSDDTSDLIPPARKLRYIEPDDLDLEMFDENDQTPVQPINTADLILCVFGDERPTFCREPEVACDTPKPNDAGPSKT